MSDSINKAKSDEYLPSWMWLIFLFAVASMVWAIFKIVIMTGSLISEMNDPVPTINTCETHPCRKYVEITIADHPNVITSMQSIVRGNIKKPIDHFPANKLVIFDCRSSECSELKPLDEGVFDCTLTNNGSRITSCTLHDVNLPAPN
ncbi:hypothetical protein KBC70_02885 [Candidatus Woesebacteria bacterium]|nr:hypothetical protein [Candidatus Woesebacteria bacterium]